MSSDKLAASDFPIKSLVEKDQVPSIEKACKKILGHPLPMLFQNLLGKGLVKWYPRGIERRLWMLMNPLNFMCKKDPSLPRFLETIDIFIGAPIKKRKIKIVKWYPPDKGFIKVNVDGSVNIKESKCGIGGLIRDDSEKFIYGFAIPIEFGDCLIAEAQACYYGLQLGYQSIVPNIVVES